MTVGIPIVQPMSILPGEDFWSVLICACRYCMGRKTYMPKTVTKWIMENCKGRMPENTITVMLHDIQQQREYGERGNWDSLGDPCDVHTWERFESWLLQQREKNNGGPKLPEMRV